MEEEEKVLIFLCAGATKSGEKKLSYKIALQLQEMNVGVIGNLEMLSHQHLLPVESKRKMVFINDCRAGCVNVLTHGFQQNQYLFIDVSPYLNEDAFNIGDFIATEIIPKMNEKWNSSKLNFVAF